MGIGDNIYVISTPDSPPVQSPLVRQMMKQQHLLNKELEKQSESNSTELAQPDAPSSVVLISPGSTNSTQVQNSSFSMHSTSNVLSNPTEQTALASDQSARDTNHSKESVPNSGELPLDDIDWGSLIGAVSADGGNEGVSKINECPKPCFYNKMENLVSLLVTFPLTMFLASFLEYPSLVLNIGFHLIEPCIFPFSLILAAERAVLLFGCI